MNLKTAKQGMFVGVVTVLGMATPAYANDTTQQSNLFENVKWERVLPNRLNVGRLVCHRLVRQSLPPKYNAVIGNYTDNYQNVLEYHLDTNGDGVVDRICKQIVQHNAQLPNYESGTVLEIVERANDAGELYAENIKPMAGYVMSKDKSR